MLVLDFVFSQDGLTALAIAAREGHVEIVQDLLSKGAYVNVGDRVSNICSGLLHICTCIVMRVKVVFGSWSVLRISVL